MNLLHRLLIGVLVGATLAFFLTSGMSPLAHPAGGRMQALLPIGAYVLAAFFGLVGAVLMFVYRNMQFAILAFGAAAGAAFWAVVLWTVFAVVFNTF